MVKMVLSGLKGDARREYAPQSYVQLCREWAEEYGLKVFDSPEYTQAMAAVTARLGVTTGG